MLIAGSAVARVRGATNRRHQKRRRRTNAPANRSRLVRIQITSPPRMHRKRLTMRAITRFREFPTLSDN
jgi:hypothetical protein